MTTPPKQPVGRKLTLASGSPRRRQLLTAAGYEFDVVVPSDSAECGVGAGETTPELVARLARQKAADVALRIASGLIVACDTVAECRGRMLGKPRDESHAREMLEWLAGHEHQVFSGLCLQDVPGGEPRVEVERTTLRMDPLSREQIDSYLRTGLWQGKAGAFGYQDGFDWLHIVEGSASNVVGLPMELLEHMLRPS